MPKKQVRNAFYFFMKELEPQLRREGRVFNNGLQDVVPIAHPRWKALPVKEKERFEKMAKDYKAKMRGADGDKYRLDNVGNIIANRKDPMSELERRRMNEKKQMRAGWPPGKELANENFYFINIQYLCVTEDEEYLPCEIAIIEYSVKRGISKKLHRFIEPGKIPTGYRFTCIQHSEHTHQIPVENFDLADNNYRGLWIQIENFINPQGEKPDYPPLYCLGAGGGYKAVEYGLYWIHQKACMGRVSRIQKVFEIESLLQEMNAHLGNNVAKSQCIDALTSTVWDYEQSTRCAYHEEKECKDCSLGIVQRYAYAISDCMCVQFDVELTGNHLPMREKLNCFTALPPSVMPVERNQVARLPQKTGNYTRPQVKQEPVSQPYKREEEEEEDYTSLRRPNIPGFPGMVAGGAAPAPSAAPWVGMMGVMGDNSRTVQPVGRGLSVDKQEIQDQKYAGSRTAPAPSMAPAPPTGWHMGGIQSNIGGHQPQGLGRGMMMQAPGISAPPLQAQTAPPRILSLPKAESLEPKSTNSYSSSSSTTANLCTGRGRGRGAILAQIMKEGCNPDVPMGRGYAPPGWVDDDSLGIPVRPGAHMYSQIYP